MLPKLGGSEKYSPSPTACVEGTAGALGQNPTPNPFAAQTVPILEQLPGQHLWQSLDPVPETPTRPFPQWGPPSVPCHPTLKKSLSCVLTLGFRAAAAAADAFWLSNGQIGRRRVFF